jgi:hypothetical protein
VKSRVLTALIIVLITSAQVFAQTGTIAWSRSNDVENINMKHGVVPAPEISSPTPGQVVYELKPTVKVNIPEDIKKKYPAVLYQYEMDTTASFDSLNHVYFPLRLNANSMSADSLKNHSEAFEYITLQGRDDNYTAEMVPPFDLSVLMFPERVGVATDKEAELYKASARLGWGRNNDETIQEVFNFVTHSVLIGTDNVMFEPVDVLFRQTAGCGTMNNLMAALLAGNKMKSRLVYCYYAPLKEAFPGSGHASLEVWNGKSYVIADAFLGFISKYGFETLKDDSPLMMASASIQSIVGETIDTSELFSSYSVLSSMDGDDLQAINKKTSAYKFNDLWPERFLRIWVRARYLASEDESLKYSTINKKNMYSKTAYVSDWTVSYFDIDLKYAFKYMKRLYEYSDNIPFTDNGRAKFKISELNIDNIELQYIGSRWVTDEKTLKKYINDTNIVQNKVYFNDKVGAVTKSLQDNWEITPGNAQEKHITLDIKNNKIRISLPEHKDGEYAVNAITKKIPVKPSHFYTVTFDYKISNVNSKVVMRIFDGSQYHFIPYDKENGHVEKVINTSEDSKYLDISFVAMNSTEDMKATEIVFSNPILHEGDLTILRKIAR